MEAAITLFTDPVLEFWVPGRAQTAGSKTARARTGPDGVTKTWVQESGSSESLVRKADWRGDIQRAAKDAMRDNGIGPWLDRDEPLSVLFIFVRKRPPAHLGTGRNAGLVKDWARDRFPTVAPDVLKTARAVEDAMNQVVYHDDSQIVAERMFKCYPDHVGLPQGTQGVCIHVRRMTEYDGPSIT